MTLATFGWTDRARPVVEVGVGDIRINPNEGRWDISKWDAASSTWSGVEPTWLDITCDTRSYHCEYGRQRTTDRYIPGTGTVVVDNTTGWADPYAATTPADISMRPGRAIRMGVVHAIYGTCWLFRGFVDSMEPTYDPTDPDTVTLSCVDALGEINRAVLTPQSPTVGDGDPVDIRIGRILDAALWPSTKRDFQPTSDTLIADALGGQVADLLGQAADSGGGSVFGDLSANIAYRARDWQTFVPGTPPDGTIGNGSDAVANNVIFGTSNVVFGTSNVVFGATVAATGTVCPTQWERPFAREDITTRVVIGRDTATAQTLDDPTAASLYGIEPFVRTDLLTQDDARITMLGQRILRVRSASVGPRIKSVSLDATTADNALDLMATVDVYKPSRYRCRLQYPRGTVFDAEHFATGVAHDVTPTAWTLALNLDLAAPYAAVGGKWDQALWDQALWSTDPVLQGVPA